MANFKKSFTMEQEILRDTIYVVQSAASASSGGWEINFKMILHQLTPIVIVCTIAALSFAILRVALKCRHQERMALIEKRALSKPEEMLPKSGQSADPLKYLRWGIIMAGTGLGFSVAVIRRAEELLLFSLPILFLGTGWIIYHYLVRSRKEKRNPEE
jgi:hypothetical protein